MESYEFLICYNYGGFNGRLSNFIVTLLLEQYLVGTVIAFLRYKPAGRFFHDTEKRKKMIH